MATSQPMAGKYTPPIESKVNIDKDYDYYIAKYNTQQPPPPPPPPRQPRKYPYQNNLGVVPMEPVMEQVPRDPSPHPQHQLQQQQEEEEDDAPAAAGKADPDGVVADENVDGDEALLDLAQLEELHHEAERMKALGNKHMAAQEYTRAYNAYSAALQLSPVGPSSHVFLSNRSAALLSLKRYSAAATDARRAIALAPTFGKAHARLGQALYFLKEYEGAVTAYKDAIEYEPDNSITRAYLEKAMAKWDRQREKQARATRGEEVSVLTENSSVQATVINSVATDPNAQAAVVQTMGFRGQSKAMTNAVAAGSSSVAGTLTTNDEDPDFDEALRIQERANRYLANKNYKSAIEEYTAALFLVPDDYNLSPDLHLGRAHALNGSRRHESAKIDAELALKIKQTPEAYSTLAKSLFYIKDFQGAIDAFGRCKQMLPEGESLSMFDRAYLQKSEAALQESLETAPVPSPPKSSGSSTTPIPKLKPPRFVPREEALSRTPNIPSMPKNWPQQSPRGSQVLHCGEEREVLFLSEALGIKLNRGPDGVVRVVDVSPDLPGSPIARQGRIEVGDVIREAAGVDLRRPITNIMWGDTVALIKMAPRPIVLVVAEEFLPVNIADQRKAAAAKALSPTSAAEYFPSNSSGDEGVRELMQLQQAAIEPEETIPESDPLDSTVQEESATHTNDDVPDPVPTTEELNENDTPQEIPQESEPVVESEPEPLETPVEELGAPVAELETPLEELETPLEEKPPKEDTTSKSSRDEEADTLGAEIFFQRTLNPKYNGWDNIRWMSHSGARKLRYFGSVYKFVAGRRAMFWSGDQYIDMKLAIYDEPNLILLLRYPENVTELCQIMDLPSGASIEDADTALKSYLVVESVIEPKTCKLKLSPLTTITSIIPDVAADDFRRRTCFEVVTPAETISLSAVRLRKGAERSLTSFTDSGAFLETSALEHSLQKSICDAHQPSSESNTTLDLSWKHQVILGTLHSIVVLGNQSSLDKALAAAKASSANVQQATSTYLDPRIVDAVDESGRTPLHYACLSRFSSAVTSLLKAGASPDTRMKPLDRTPCHICALNLDSKSLAAILSVNRRPNVLDATGRTPAFLAMMEGRSVGGTKDASALDSCMAVLESNGAQFGAPTGFRNPVSTLASMWNFEELFVVSKYVHHRYPIVLDTNEKTRVGISVEALYQYPIHSCLISLRKHIKAEAERNPELKPRLDWTLFQKRVIETLDVLLKCGFEPNERLEAILERFEGAEELAIHVGFAPIQILAAAALDAMACRDQLGGALFMSIVMGISKITSYLIENGGRVSLEAPPLMRSKDRVFPSMDIELNNSAEVYLLPVDRSLLKIQANKQLAELLGIVRSNPAEKVWADTQTTESTGDITFHTDKLVIEDSAAPGGSDAKSCAICWKAFGTLSNRKHRCRISRRHVCDECSSKRVRSGVEGHRVSDGQFLLAKADFTAAKSRKQHEAGLEFQRRVAQQQTARTAAEVRLDRLEAQEAANRDSLFGNLVGNMSKAVFGEEGQDVQTTQSDSIQGLSNRLNETRDALNQRGEKLSTLADKSDKLVNASKDFASMAKELNRKSQGGLFW